MRRGLSVVSIAVLVAMLAGCGSSGGRPRRGIAVGLLLGLTAAAAGGTVYAANVSKRKEEDLRNDVQTGTLTGRQFGERDEEGRKWNRYARASAFVGVLGVVGLIVVGEMMLADGNQYGPLSPPKEKPIIPGASPEPPPTAKLPLTPTPSRR